MNEEAQTSRTKDLINEIRKAIEAECFQITQAIMKEGEFSPEKRALMKQIYKNLEEGRGYDDFLEIMVKHSRGGGEPKVEP